MDLLRVRKEHSNGPSDGTCWKANDVVTDKLDVRQRRHTISCTDFGGDVM